MGKAIADYKIGADLYAAGDIILEDQALPNNTTAFLGSEFLLPQTMGGVQLNFVTGTAGLDTGAGTLAINVYTSPTSGGTFDNLIYSITLDSSYDQNAGVLIDGFIVPRDVTECYAKISATTGVDLSGQDLTAYIVGVC